jgi:hypothetical protein
MFYAHTTLFILYFISIVITLVILIVGNECVILAILIVYTSYVRTMVLFYTIYILVSHSLYIRTKPKILLEFNFIFATACGHIPDLIILAQLPNISFSRGYFILYVFDSNTLDISGIPVVSL